VLTLKCYAGAGTCPMMFRSSIALYSRRYILDDKKSITLKFK
jgi:hypothetical protein